MIRYARVLGGISSSELNASKASAPPARGCNMESTSLPWQLVVVSYVEGELQKTKGFRTAASTSNPAWSATRALPSLSLHTVALFSGSPTKPLDSAQVMFVGANSWDSTVCAVSTLD